MLLKSFMALKYFKMFQSEILRFISVIFFTFVFRFIYVLTWIYLYPFFFFKFSFEQQNFFYLIRILRFFNVTALSLKRYYIIQICKSLTCVANCRNA